MTTVTIPRATVPVTGAAAMSPEWYRWAHDITQRAGGATGSNVSSDVMQALVRASHAQQAQAGSPTPPDMGYIQSFVARPESAVTALNFVELRAMLPHTQANQPTVDDAQAVIASRVFRR